MPLHRYVDPTYFLGVGVTFPGTIFGTAYDRINVTSGGVGAGGSAFADVAKAAGPNVGTYFVAFGEDATSVHFNRGHRALAQNTDYLDDVVHRDLAVRNLAVVVSAGDTSTDLDGSVTPVFVGNPGAVAELLFVLTAYPSLEPLYDPVTGAQIVVSSISGATLGTGFSAANPITLNFSATIPNGVTYIVWYADRGNLATHPSDLVADLLPAHATTAPSVGAIFRGGLDARYRNASSAGAAALDTPGAGAVINRDGPAPAVDVQDTTALFDDPIGACWKAFSSASSAGGFISGELSGLGFAHYVSDRGSTDSAEQGPANSAGSFASVWPHDYTGVLAGTVRTQIRAGYATGTTLNPGGVGGDVVQAGVGDFFYNGSLESAVNTGFDLLEVTRASGTVECYVITQFDTGDQRRCYVRDLSGATPAFPPNESVTLRWITTKFWQGPSTGVKYDLVNGPSGDVVYLGNLQHFVSPPNGHTAPLSESFPIFGARDNTSYALAWMGFNADASTGYSGALLGLSSTKTHGVLQGDGGIRTGGNSSFGAFKYKRQSMSVSGTGSQQWDLDAYPLLVIDVTSDGETLTLTLPGSLSATDGQRCAVVVRLGAAVSTFTLAWPTSPYNFVFSTSGDKTPTQGPDSVTRYDGVFGLNGFLVTKTAYPGGGVTGP